MKVLVRGGSQDGQVIGLGRVIHFGGPDWIDPESTDFDQRSDKSATYELRPLKAASVTHG